MIKSRSPFDEREIKTIRSMSFYWQEVRQREDTSPLRQEVATVSKILHGDKLLLAAEFCADPIRLAAYELRSTCVIIRSITAAWLKTKSPADAQTLIMHIANLIEENEIMIEDN